jgi:integrase
VDLPGRELRIRAEKARDGEDRILPISSRLAAVLEMAKLDPGGEEYGLDKYVFGELGFQIDSPKRAWKTACDKAGISDLRFHDLRHEAGSRLLEAGFQLHQVREMLGHANLSQISTYLNAGRLGLQDAMRRVDASRCNSVAIEPPTVPPTDRNGVTEETPKHLIN